MKLKEHRQDGFFELTNTSRIWVGGLDDNERVEKILGLEYASIFLNEPRKFPMLRRSSRSRAWRRKSKG